MPHVQPVGFAPAEIARRAATVRGFRNDRSDGIGQQGVLGRKFGIKPVGRSFFWQGEHRFLIVQFVRIEPPIGLAERSEIRRQHPRLHLFVTGGVKCSHDGRGQMQPPRVGSLVMKKG